MPDNAHDALKTAVEESKEQQAQEPQDQQPQEPVSEGQQDGGTDSVPVDSDFIQDLLNMDEEGGESQEEPQPQAVDENLKKVLELQKQLQAEMERLKQSSGEDYDDFLGDDKTEKLMQEVEALKRQQQVLYSIQAAYKQITEADPGLKAFDQNIASELETNPVIANIIAKAGPEVVPVVLESLYAREFYKNRHKWWKEETMRRIQEAKKKKENMSAKSQEAGKQNVDTGVIQEEGVPKTPKEAILAALKNIKEG